MSHNPTPETEKDPTPKWLVRFLIIVGIGVPVLIELFTFSGLVSNHLWDGDEKRTEPQRTAEATEPSTVSRGDTLFVGSKLPFVIQTLQLEIYPDKWVFTLGLSPQRSEQIKATVLIRSLHTQNRVRDEDKMLTWSATDTTAKTVTWTLESSERPLGIEINKSTDSQKGRGAAEDKSAQYFKFGHIPAAYYK